MEINTDERLKSSVYRCLFEFVQQEGIEKALDFFTDIDDNFRNSERLLEHAITGRKNDLLSLVKRHSSIVKYLRSHKNELNRFSFLNENYLKVLESLSTDFSQLELYLKNAKRLEELKVESIILSNFLHFNFETCEIYRDAAGKIITINKGYSDGQISDIKDENLISKYFNYSEIKYMVCYDKATFSLEANNCENGQQYRTIRIENFGFDGSKLPTEEELSSYEIPKQLIK